MCHNSYAQTTTYLVNTHEPTEQKGYKVQTSVGIHGGETWGNAFTIWDEGMATFELGKKMYTNGLLLIENSIPSGLEIRHGIMDL